MEVLRNGTKLHLASFCLADTELSLEGADNPAFVALNAEYVDVLGGAPPGLPPDRGMGLVMEKGEPMQRQHPVKRLSKGGLPRPRPQVDPALDGRPRSVGGVRAW